MLPGRGPNAPLIAHQTVSARTRVAAESCLARGPNALLIAHQ